MRINWWKWHKWLALVVGLQVLAWALSGLFMSVVPIEQVRGEHLRRTMPPADLSPWLGRVVVPTASGPVPSLELVVVEGQPVWLVGAGHGPERQLRRVDALTGRDLPVLDAAAVRRLALLDYAGPGRMTAVRMLQEAAPVEYRGPLPVWQVTFDDPDGTRLYLAADSGKVVARRTGTWRLYDFLWSLHIMDYREHEDFNHPLLVVFAAGLLLLTLSGAVLVWKRFGRAVVGRRRPPTTGSAIAVLLLVSWGVAPEARAGGPPMNPYLAQTFNNQGHWNDAATDATDLAVPKGHYRMTPDGAEVVPSETLGIPIYHDVVAGKEVFWFWAGFSLRKLHREQDRFVEIDRVSIDPGLPGYQALDSAARMQQADAVRGYLERGDEPGLADYLRQQPNRLLQAVDDQVRLGILYSMLARDNAFIGSNARGLVRIEQANPADPYSRLLPPQSVTLPDTLFDDARARRQTIFPTDTVFGLGMTFNGFLVVNTVGGRIITLDRRTLAPIDVYQARGEDEVFTNSFATSGEAGGGAIYVASNTTMYRLVVDATGHIHDDAAAGAWREPYDRGVRLPAGKISDGTGATPTLMGFGPRDDRLVVLTDGARKMKLVAFWRDGVLPRQAKGRRLADQIEVDLGPKVPVVQSEQSVVAENGYAFVINNVPAPGAKPYAAAGSFYRALLVGATREAPSGAAMFRWDARRNRWVSLWQRRDVGFIATVPMLSVGSRMVVMNGHYAGHLGSLYHLGLDVDTGRTVMSIETGLDPQFNGSFTGLKCDPAGNLFYPTMFGLVRFDVTRMQRLSGPPAADRSPP